TPSTLNEYHQSCSSNGPTVTDQIPWSSLFIGIALPMSQLPVKTTACAFGATSRKVTFFSGDTSGDTTRGPCGRRPAPGCEWEGPTDRNTATANPVRNLTLLMLPRLPCLHTPESAPASNCLICIDNLIEKPMHFAE